MQNRVTDAQETLAGSCERHMQRRKNCVWSGSFSCRSAWYGLPPWKVTCRVQGGGLEQRLSFSAISVRRGVCVGQSCDPRGDMAERERE